MMDVIKIVDKKIEEYKEMINIDIDEFKFNTYTWRIEEYIINPLYDLEKEEMSKSIKYMYQSIKDIVVEIIDSNNYKKMLDKLQDKEIVKYIEERNKMLKNSQLEEFILKHKKKDDIIKLTPPDVVYGKR